MDKHKFLKPVLCLLLLWNLPVPVFSSPSASLNYGFHIWKDSLDFKIYQKTSSVSFEKALSIRNIAGFSSIFQTPVWSFSADSSKIKKTPVTFKIQTGDLSFSGAVSKLRSPGLSGTFSYFNQGPVSTNDLGISEPSSSASSKTKSAAITVKAKDFKLSFASDTDGFIKSSVSFTSRPADFFTASFLFSYADFELISKQQSSWRLSEPAFISGKKHAVYAETLVSIPLFKAKLGFSALENPFDTVRFYNNCDFLFHYGFFSVSFSGFLCDSAFMEFYNPVYSLSQTKTSVCCQAKINPMLDFSIKKSHFKTGIAVLYENSMKTDDSKQDTLFISAGFSIISEKNRFSMIYKLQNIDLTDFTIQTPSLTNSTDEKLKHSVSAKYTHRFRQFSAAVSLTASSEPKQLSSKSAFSQSVTAYIYPYKFPVKTASISMSFDERNSTVKPSFSGAISAEYSTKNLKITAKIGVTGPLVVE